MMVRFKIQCILHHFLLTLSFFLTSSIFQKVSTHTSHELNSYPPILKTNQMIICKSQKPYHICETLYISDPSCSSSLNYASPNLLPTGFTSRPDSVLLYNCSNSKPPSSPLLHTSTCFHASGALSKIKEHKGMASTSCLLIDDLRKLHMELSPSDLKCSCYSSVKRISLGENIDKEPDLKARSAFEVPDHIPNICIECQKVNGNCGAALRCICHPKQCENRVTSKGGSIISFGNYILIVLFLQIVTLTIL